MVWSENGEGLEDVSQNGWIPPPPPPVPGVTKKPGTFRVKWLKFHILCTYLCRSIHTFYVWLLAILNPMFILEIYIISTKYFGPFNQNSEPVTQAKIENAHEL